MIDPYSTAKSTILFICTGNFYRSRFAEAFFNNHANRRDIQWCAISRGLATHLVVGHISPWTLEALEKRGIPLNCTGHTCIQLEEQDLIHADRAIALEHEEHYFLMQDLFPTWANSIEYWDVPDIGDISTEVAFEIIEDRVTSLLDELQADS